MVTSDRKKWFALALILAVQFMVILDVAIVNVALPSIQVDLGFSQENLQWVISAYALVFGGFLLLGGRSADLLGRRRIFIFGTIVFTIGSLLCGFAWSDEALIAFRALQGLGAATITPAALSILVWTFKEGRERNIALGAWGAVGGFGAAAGVLFGGILTDFLSWEWIFWVNVPVGIAALILAPILLSESLDKHGQGFDIPGAVLVTSGLSLLVLGITQGRGWGWGSAETLGVFIASAVLLVAFVLWEQREKDPLVPFSIFRLQTLTAANVVGLFLGTGMFAMFLMLTLYMQQVLEFSPLKTGVGYLAVAGTAIIWANVAAAAVTRVGVKPALVVRDVRHDGRDPLLHAGLGRRLVLDRPVPGLPPDRSRAAVRVRSRDDRGGRRDEAAGGGSRVGAHQHVAADRRRSRHRDPLDHRGLDDRRRARDRNGGARGADRRLPGCVLGGRGDHVRGRARLGLHGSRARPAGAGSARRRACARAGRLTELDAAGTCHAQVPVASHRGRFAPCGFARTRSSTPRRSRTTAAAGEACPAGCR